jgi:amino acid transporter
MRDMAIITLTSAVFFVPITCIAAALLLFRDRHFPRKPRPEQADPWCPPKWARCRRTVWLFLVVLTPVYLVAMMMFVIVMLPVYARESDEHVGSESADAKRSDPRVK